MRFKNGFSSYGIGFEYHAESWYFSGDLRHWMIGFEWIPSEVALAFGPFRLEVYRGDNDPEDTGYEWVKWPTGETALDELLADDE